MPSESGTMFPGLRYKNAPAAIDWLCDVLGFDRKLVIPGEDNNIVHAQLQLGAGIIMLGSVNENEFGKHVKPPDFVDKVNTQVAYIYIKDIDKHYQNAKSKGAEMVVELREEEYGGKYYLCRDPEGHLWSIGSYDPFSEPL